MSKNGVTCENFTSCTYFHPFEGLKSLLDKVLMFFFFISDTNTL